MLSARNVVRRGCGGTDRVLPGGLVIFGRNNQRGTPSQELRSR